VGLSSCALPLAGPRGRVRLDSIRRSPGTHGGWGRGGTGHFDAWAFGTASPHPPLRGDFPHKGGSNHRRARRGSLTPPMARPRSARVSDPADGPAALEAGL
jgi:hypothetical protein